MRMPNLERIRREHEQEPRIGRSCSPLHPVPHLWKHEWRLFTRHSTREGSAFLTSKREVLCTAEAIAWLEIYRLRGESVWIYGCKLPRRDPRSPFDPKHPRWRKRRWAPALDKDRDPFWLSPQGILYR